MIINNFDTDINFWELYPDLKIALSFKDLYKSDKSRGKDVSSRKMWFVALTNAPTSKYINIPLEERYEVIGEDYMGDKNYYWMNQSILDPLISDLFKLNDTPSQRHLRQWIITIEDRTQFLKTVSYSLDNYDKLDKMNANTAALMTTFGKIQEMISKEESGSGSVKGGGQESLADTGEI